MINREGFQRHHQQSPVVNPLDPFHQQYTQVPRISFTVPFMDLGLITFAISMISSRDMLPECLMFFTFLRSRSGSLRALMTRAAAEGTTETLAWRLWTVSLTQTLPILGGFFGYVFPYFLWGETEWADFRSEWGSCTDLSSGDTSTTWEGSNFGGIFRWGAAAMAFKFIMDVVLYR